MHRPQPIRSFDGENEEEEEDDDEDVDGASMEAQRKEGRNRQSKYSWVSKMAMENLDLIYTRVYS
jgi:hypothetical protein